MRSNTLYNITISTNRSNNELNSYIYNNLLTLRTIIYFYIFFVIFNGTLRKWVFPQFSDIIMIFMDVIPFIIFIASANVWKRFTNWELASIILGIISLLFTLSGGHGNLLVGLFGVFPLIIGIPICFILGKTLKKSDVIIIGKWIVYISILNSLLICIQFMLPTTHILNFGGGRTVGTEGMSISMLAGGFRPPGLFYHNTQNVSFCSLAFSYMLYFFFVKKEIINKHIIHLCLILELISVVFSASRTNVLVHFGIICFFFLFSTDIKKKMKFMQVSLFIVPFILILSLTTILGSAFDNIGKRFESASQSQYRGFSTTQGTINDIVYRGIIYNIEALITPKTFSGEKPPFFGFGQGMGTQVGGRIMGGIGKKHSGFALAEFDGLRIMCESGILVGWLIIILRIGYAFRYLFKIEQLREKRKYLSLSLMPSFLLMFYLTSTWGNIFVCNFAFITGGLFIKSLKYRKSNDY